MQSLLQKPRSGLRLDQNQCRFTSSTDAQANDSLKELKMTAEKMIKEQALVKTDLLFTNSKLEQSERDVRTLKCALQETRNVNAMLQVKQEEALKLWDSLEVKFSSSKTYCNQLMDTLQQLAHQVQEAENAKRTLEEKLVERSRFYEEIKLEIDALLSKKEASEKIAANWEKEYTDMTELHKQVVQSLALERDKVQQLQAEKANAEAKVAISSVSLQQERERIGCIQDQLDKAQNAIKMNAIRLNEIEEIKEKLTNDKCVLRSQVEALEATLISERDKNSDLKETTDRTVAKVKDLEEANGRATDNIGRLLIEIAGSKEWVLEERRAKERAFNELKDLQEEYHKLNGVKISLEKQVESIEKEIRSLTERHKIAQKESSETMEHLRKEILMLQQNFNNQTIEKIELAHRYEILQDNIASLRRNIEELSVIKDNVTKENCDLRTEIDSINARAQVSTQNHLDEVAELNKKILSYVEWTVKAEEEKLELEHACATKDRTIQCMLEEQERLTDRVTEAIERKASAEHTADEIRKNVETQLEVKQMELNKHLREISERNDKEMADMRKKYENETKEAIKMEEAKAKAALEAMKEEYDLKILRIQESALREQKVKKEEYEIQLKEMMHNHETEKQKCEDEKNIELIHKLESEKSKWMKQSEIRCKEMETKFQGEIKKLTDKFSHRSKGDEKALKLETQVRALEDQLKQERLKREEDLQTSSKKYEESISKLASDRKELEHNHQKAILELRNCLRNELEEYKRKAIMWESRYKSLLLRNKHSFQDSASQAFSSGTGKTEGLGEGKKINQTPPLGKETPMIIEKAKCDNVNLPAHSKTVTHHEYEVATSDGRKTIRRKRTRSTVKFETQPALDAKRTGGRKSTRLVSQHRKVKPSRMHMTTSMVDLFAGKSLDPYVDDPYAFI